MLSVQRPWVAQLLSLAMLAPPAMAATTFSDNFDSGASPLWGNEQGNWHVVGGAYDAQHPSTFPNAYSSLPFDLSNFSVEFDVDKLQDGGVWLRSSPAAGSIGRSGVLLVTGGRGGTGTGLYWHIVTSPNTYGPLLAEDSGLFVPGISNAHIRVVVSGNQYAAFVNGSNSPATTLVTGAFSNGQVALYDYSGQTFDNVQLSSAVPEPISAATLGMGLALLAVTQARAASSRGGPSRRGS